MSPSVPILFALLLTLISGSTEGGWGTDSVALLRQTLRYWRKIYNTYEEEVTLGYCWADYLVQISVELSTNPSASLFATGDRSNTTAWATKSQRNPFPENVMADATQRGETLRGHLREKRSHATTRSTISEFMKDPNGHRIATGWKITGKRERRMTNEAGQGVAVADARQGADKTDRSERIAAMTDSYVGKRRRALPIVQLDLPHGGRELPLRHEFPSRGTSWRAVNPTPNPKDDDKVDSTAPREHVEEDARRKVLRAATTNHRGSIGRADRPRLFSLKVSPARRRKSLDTDGPRRLLSHERDPAVSEPFSAPQDRRATTTSDPEGRGVPLNKDRSPPLQFGRVNVRSSKRGRTGVVKLMDSKGNSSRDSAWPMNSRTPRRKRGELSRDSLLSPLEEGTSAGQAVEENPPAPGAEQRRRYRSRREKGSSYGRKVLPIRSGGFSSRFERLRQSMFSENRGIPCSMIIPRNASLSHDEHLRKAISTLLATRAKRFAGAYKGNEISTSELTENSAMCAPETIKQRSLYLLHLLPRNIRPLVIGVLGTMGMLVQIGRQIMDVVDSNVAFSCTKQYLWLKIEKWLDT